MYEFFWMAVGGTIVGVITHLYKNKNFQTALREERQKFKETLKITKLGD